VQTVNSCQTDLQPQAKVSLLHAVDDTRKPTRICYTQSMARVNPQTYNSIKGLAEDPNTVIVIFSGSAKVQGKLTDNCSLSTCAGHF